MIERLDDILRKLDELRDTMRGCRPDVASIIVHQWVALFFIPMIAFIGSMLWLRFR